MERTEIRDALTWWEVGATASETADQEPTRYEPSLAVINFAALGGEVDTLDDTPRGSGTRYEDQAFPFTIEATRGQHLWGFGPGVVAHSHNSDHRYHLLGVDTHSQEALFGYESTAILHTELRVPLADLKPGDRRLVDAALWNGARA